VLELAGHYHFAPQPCAVARGNEKGRVERFIGFLRPAFFAARTFRSVADLNTQLTRWIAEVAHARPVPGRREQRVADALAEEQPRLLPLPEHPLACDLLRAVSSGKTPYIRFDGNDYSIPHTLVRRPLTLVASEHQVRRGAANPFEGVILQDPQELGLKRGVHLADLVEEDGAAVGQLELALLPLMGAGEGSLLVTEQLAGDELLAQDGAVDDDERRARTAGSGPDDGGTRW
jgi:hypothetical protein